MRGCARVGEGVFGMVTISGQTVHKKTVIGRLQYLSKTHPELLRTPAADVQAELAAFRKAKAEVVGRLHELYRESIAKVGELLAHTFEIQPRGGIMRRCLRRWRTRISGREAMTSPRLRSV